MSNVLLLDSSLLEVPNVAEAKAALVDFCLEFQDRWGKHPIYSMVPLLEGTRLRIRTQYDSARNMADHIKAALPC